MTIASTLDVRRPRAILSQLLVVLALVLFGLPKGHPNGMAANAGPAAQSDVEQAQGILLVQRVYVRAQLPDNVSPDGFVPGGGVDPWPSCNVATISPAPHQSVLPSATRILPPVRGPPAA